LAAGCARRRREAPPIRRRRIAKRAAGEKFSPLNLSREREKFRSAKFPLLADLPHFRNLNPVKLSRSRCRTRVWRRAAPAERRLRRLLANRVAVCAKRAEREKFSPLNLSRECEKFRSAKFPLLADLPHFRNPTLLNFRDPVAKCARHAAEGGKPREAGSAQAKLARRARNVKNLQCLIYHGSVRNLEVLNFCTEIYNGSVKNPEVNAHEHCNFSVAK
jgi:hypothetical protein